MRSQSLTLRNTYQSIVSGVKPYQWRLGLHWYRSANATARHLAEKHSVRTKTAARCLAILSANTNWDSTVQAAEGVLSGNLDKARSGHGINRNLDKALRAISIDGPEANRLVTGPKVSKFYESILMKSGAVCIDRWMYKPNRMGYDSESPPIDYHRSGWRAVRMLASQHGVKSYQMQAIIWVHLRHSS